jgi:chemotaxis-related protein WspB
MLFLLFHIGDHLYAIDTAQVTEVIPCIMLRKIQSVPDYVAGVFNYRGQIVQVIDLCELIQGTSSRLRFSTRIIMINYCDRAGASQYLGLMAECVTETLSRPDLTATDASSTVPYLGNLFVDEKGMIQQIYWEPLVPGYSALLTQGMLQTDGTGSD